MNKKVIKYLIWTILIAAVFILIPLRHEMALSLTNGTEKKIAYNTFKTEPNLFCLNQGYPYGKEEKFDVSKVDRIDLPYGDMDMLKYILSEITGTKTSVSGSEYQSAIWNLRSNVWKGTKIDEAKALVAKAKDYSTFATAYRMGSVYNPKVEKISNTQFAVYYTKVGNYSNLVSVSTGGKATCTTEGQTVNITGYTHRDIYTKNDGVNKIDVTINYENDLRKATKLFYLASEEQDNGVVFKVEDTKYFLEGDGNYICLTCGQGECISSFRATQTITEARDYIEKTLGIHNLSTTSTTYRCINYPECSDHYLVVLKNGSNTYYYVLDSDIEGDFIDPDTGWKVMGHARLSRTNYKYNPQDLLYGEGSKSTEPKLTSITFIEPVTLNFNKKDFNGNNVTGATLSISKVDNVDTLSTTSITIGSGSVTVMPANGNSGTFKIKLSESAPAEYKGIPDTTLTVSYNNGAVTGITSSNTTYVPNSSNKNVTIKNKPKTNLIINKTDALSGAKLNNARFKIELSNVESIDGYSVTDAGKGTIYVTTQKIGEINGQIKLTGIVPKGGLEGTITATITEVAVPVDKNSVTDGGQYYILDSTPITIKMTYNDGSWTVSGDSVNGTSISSNAPTKSGNTITLGIKNQPYIKFSGNVWKDGQIGVKDVQGPNGNKETTEGGMKGVLVQVFNPTETSQAKDVSGNKAGTFTDNNGNYYFEDIPQTDDGYIIRFWYNGLKYQETKSAGSAGRDSIPNEVNRQAFNNKFTTISQGKSNGDANGEIPLTYKYNSSNQTSKLLASTVGHTAKENYNEDEAKTYEDFRFSMKAKTGTYKTVKSNVNCGIIEKELDLAIGTDVKSAKLQINGKTTTYSYAQIMNGELNADFQNSSSTAENVIYNLYLYSSDYNYRISDYKTDVAGENKNTILNNISPTDKLVNNFEELKELEAFVTYSVILKAQTTQNATIEEFVYYYDDAYTPHNIVSTDKYNVSIDTSARKITFTSKNNGFKLTSSNDYRVEVDLTFKINEKPDGSLIVNETATNIAEITRYSTDKGGLIDKDSAPANGITNGKVTQYEDDTDEAKGLNIILRTDEARTITGTVIKDADKDGVLKDTEPKVNGVVVQLIEIKKIGGQYYEYIWQETQTGSNKVLATPRNGYSNKQYEYTNSVQEGSGKFEFKDFIPGNYIIRYIYGDVVRTEERYKDIQEVYNGQDYKSTIDLNYTKSWYNTSNYSNVQSIARDNEARRLEVMSHSTTVNSELYEKEQEIMDSKGEDWKYHYTWMAAETSKINIPVDADNKATETNSTTASYSYTKNNTKVLFGNMNFGLALRPQANIVLEKHITALKITPSGTGVQSLVDAKAESIENIVNGNEVKVQGITDGLATIKSTAENRGFWQVATDVEELMQGAELEVEYTYVLRNDSEEDYLTSFLVEQYENKIGNGTYSTLLTSKASEVKAATKGQTQKYGSYLGQFYYTGTKGANDALVSARVELFEEALNNDFTFDETEATSFKITQEDVNKKVYGVNKAEGTKDIEIDTIVQNKTVSEFLTPKLGTNHTIETADWSRTINLTTTLATVSGGELGANLPSYIAEILQYSNAAGRIDMKAKIANLSYVHSDDTNMTMVSDNEQDEFWAESIIITKPTGEDKLTPIQIVIITISAIAVLGVGIVLIKKFVLKK